MLNQTASMLQKTHTHSFSKIYLFVIVAFGNIDQLPLKAQVRGTKGVFQQ
jgi:hypothetical protein